jgi:hypothetical protein
MFSGARRYRAAVLAALIGCAPLAACSSSGDAPPGTSADPLARAAAFLVAYAQRHAQPLAVIDVQPGGAKVSQRWNFIKLLNGGRNVLVSYQLGTSCERELGFRVQESGAAVELSSLTENHTGMCSQPAPVGYGTVQLSRPLGDRTLLHAPTVTEVQNELTWQLRPWAFTPIHPTDDPTIMLIDMSQGSRDTHSACWEHSRTTTRLVAGRFEITLWVADRTDQVTDSCTANSAAGPFYATVHLPQPYDGQLLIDAVLGRNHQPADLVHLSDVPAKFR